MFRRFNEKSFTEKAIRILTVITLIIGIPVAIKTLWPEKDNTEKILTSGQNSPVITGDGNTINNNTYNSSPSVSLSKPPTKEKIRTEVNSPNLNLKKTVATNFFLNNGQIKIAILPFENLSNDPKYEWLSKGLAESLLEPITKIEKYVVLEGTLRNKVVEEIDFQQGKYVDVASAVKIGKMLGAENIVIGSFQTNGSSIRITARIIDIEKGKVLDKSTSTFDGSTDFPFQMQKDFSIQFSKNLYE